MENASKALLIAAAVLIVIVLIGVGVSILNSTDTSTQVDSATSAQEMQAFNAQFTGYLGASRAGTTIPNLLAIVNRSNTSNTQHDVQVYSQSGTIKGAADYTTSTTVSTTQQSISSAYSIGANFVSNAKYSITAAYDTNGYIVSIVIQ